MEVKFSVSTLIGFGIATFALRAQLFKGEVSIERLIPEICLTGAVVYFVYCTI